MLAKRDGKPFAALGESVKPLRYAQCQRAEASV
jgi:hypothetical protein